VCAKEIAMIELTAHLLLLTPGLITHLPKGAPGAAKDRRRAIAPRM